MATGGCHQKATCKIEEPILVKFIARSPGYYGSLDQPMAVWEVARITPVSDSKKYE